MIREHSHPPITGGNETLVKAKIARRSEEIQIFKKGWHTLGVPDTPQKLGHVTTGERFAEGLVFAFTAFLVT